jgi:hypothetical protein
MSGERECTTSRVFAKSGAMMERLLGEKTFDTRRGDDTGWDLRRVKAEHRNISKSVRGRDAKNAIANRDVTVTISRDEASATRGVDRKGTIRKEMGFLVRSRSLGTVIKVSSRTVVVMVANGIDGVLAKDAIGIENVL